MSNESPILRVLPISSINQSERLREDYGDLDSDFSSVFTHGLIQPIVVTLSGGQIVLVAGGRRLRYLETHGVTELHHGVTSDPTKFGFVFCEELSEQRRLELEVAENVGRKPMSWQEQVRALARIHNIKKDSTDRWTTEMTGRLIGRSAASVKSAIQVAKALEANDAAVIKAETFTEAYSILLRRAGVKLEQRAAQLREAEQVRQKAEKLAQVRAKKTAPANAQEVDELLSVPPANIAHAEVMKVAAMSKEEKRKVAESFAADIFTCCDSLRVGMPQLGPESVDHVYTDIPYAIDMDNLDMKNIDVTAAEHDKASNLEDFELFLKQSFLIIKPEGFCVFWADMEHFGTLVEIGQRIGFSCQRWPMIWHKSGGCKNEVPRFNTTKNYEIVCVFRKPGATLNKVVTSSIFTGDWESNERTQYIHPFVKPQAAHDKMLSMFLRPGQTVCDPYCGEGSGVLALLRNDAQVVAFDIVQDHINRATSHVVEQLCKSL